MAFDLDVAGTLDVCAGATVLGSGGGGSYRVARNLVSAGMPSGGRVRVADVGEVEPDAWACVCAIVGLPEEQFKNPTRSAPANAVAGLQQLLQAAPSLAPGFTASSEIRYVLPVEVGAMTVAAPLILGARTGRRVVNADGAGRAIPAMMLDTYAAHGLPLFPNCIASEAGPGEVFAKAFIDVPGPRPEERALSVLLGVVMSDPFGRNAALATYVMNGATLREKPPVAGTLEDALAIGRIVNSGQEARGILGQIIACLGEGRAAGPRLARPLFHGFVTSVTEGEDGRGEIVLTSDRDGGGDRFTIYYQFDNVLGALNSDAASPCIMGPDSICYLPVAPIGDPPQPVIENSELVRLWKQNLKPELTLLGIDAPKGVKSNATLLSGWRPVYERCGYTGSYCQPWLDSGYQTT